MDSVWQRQCSLVKPPFCLDFSQRPVKLYKLKLLYTFHLNCETVISYLEYAGTIRSPPCIQQIVLPCAHKPFTCKQSRRVENVMWRYVCLYGVMFISTIFSRLRTEIFNLQPPTTANMWLCNSLIIGHKKLIEENTITLTIIKCT